jgi:hypothetical protein
MDLTHSAARGRGRHYAASAWRLVHRACYTVAYGEHFTTWRRGWAAACAKRSESMDCEEDEEKLVKSREYWRRWLPQKIKPGPRAVSGDEEPAVALLSEALRVHCERLGCAVA